MNKEQDFDHPCKETCSGWKQGYEKGKAELNKKQDKFLESIHNDLLHILRFLNANGVDEAREVLKPLILSIERVRENAN